MRDTWKQHWPEYAIEAGYLGAFMVSACTFATIFGHPESPVARAIHSPLLGRLLMGSAMGLTIIALIYSPWGKRSGAHMNPSVTFAFWRLDKIHSKDALSYILAQFAGGVLGVLVARGFLGNLISHPAVNYVVTAPGDQGPIAAFVAEFVISFGLMLVILMASNAERLARYTGLFAGLLVAAYIAFETPLSGMSMNPARTFGSAVFANVWTALWVYFIAPPLGMILAAEVYVRLRGARPVHCAKLHHQNRQRCIFRCGYAVKAAVGR